MAKQCMLLQVLASGKMVGFLMHSESKSMSQLRRSNSQGAQPLQPWPLSHALSFLYALTHTTPCMHLLCMHAPMYCLHGFVDCTLPSNLSCSGPDAHAPGSLHLLHLLIRALVLLALLGLRDRGICPQPGAPQGHNRHNDSRIAPVLGRCELAQGQVRPLHSSG